MAIAFIRSDLNENFMALCILYHFMFFFILAKYVDAVQLDLQEVGGLSCNFFQKV